MANVFWQGTCLAFLLSGAAAAAPLTEIEAVKRGLAHPDVRATLAARLDIAAGNAAAAGRWTTPEIEYSEETLGLAAGDSKERSIWVRQRLNIAGVHGLERDAAERLQLAEISRNEIAEREIAADIRRLFHAALAADTELNTVIAWQSRLEELIIAVERRVNAGDASRYDHLRLQRELALLRGDALDAQATAESARDRLFSRIGGQETELQGSLLPPPPDMTMVAELVGDHPLLRVLDAEAASASLSAKAAGRESWPEITLGLGRRDMAEPNFDSDGNLVMLAVEVPLFDRGDGNKFAAESRARRLEAERTLVASRLAADARAILRELEAHRQAALALQANDPQADALAAIAESAYAEGEIGVMELVDAHRTDLAAQREAIARSHAARESYIELQSLRGNL